VIGPSANDIIAARWRVRIVLRMATLLLTIVALAWIALQLREFLEVRQVASAGFGQMPHPLDFEWFAIPVVLLIVAVVFALVARFGLAMIVDVPRPKCPKCGYDLDKPTSDKCPECGLRLGALRANDPA
jgi:hypothetical protein